MYGSVDPVIPVPVRLAKSPLNVLTDGFKWLSGNPVIRFAVSFAVSASLPSAKPVYVPAVWIGFGS